MLNRRQMVMMGAMSAGTWGNAYSQAGDFPRTAVKVIVPGAPGGPAGTVAYAVAQGLEELWKKPVVLDYKAGAGAVVGMTELSRAAPDGHTLGLMSSAFVINSLTHKKLAFDPAKDLTGVTLLVEASLAILANPSAPFNTLAEMVAYSKRNPGKLNFGTSGLKGTAHLAGELLNRAAGIDLQVVGYKGSSPCLTDLMGGQIPLAIDNTTIAMQFLKTGRMKIIATLGSSRDPLVPNIPTVSETYPNVEVSTFFGFAVPGKTPRPIIDQIARDTRKVVVNTGIGERITQMGMQLRVEEPEALNRRIQREGDKWRPIVKDLKLDED